MSKAYRGKTCAYCAKEEASSTADHVFARQFFPVEQRGNLPIVAACAPCNQAKSQLEHYLATVLPFGGRHVDSSAMLENEVPRRLARNKRLHRELAAGRVPVLLKEGEETSETFGVPFDSDRFRKLFAYIARGLAMHHWQVVIPSSHVVESVILNPVYEPEFRRLFLLCARQRVNGSVGGGAFLYQGAQAVDDAALTMWRFQAFGGVMMMGDEHVPGAGDYTVWVTTARRSLIPEPGQP
jgi:hypothetical protein